MADDPTSTYGRIYTRLLAFRNRHEAFQPALRAVNRVLHIRPPVRFRGWGMTTQHALPWEGDDWAGFRSTMRDAKALSHTGEAGIDRDYLDELAWRHWIVCHSVRHAILFSGSPDASFVECGVADGVTSFFALREILAGARPHGEQWRMHLYDAWSGMSAANLLTTEADREGRYQNLSLELTRSNLKEFEDLCVYHVGRIPDSFREQPGPPESVRWVHIDLNAAVPTRDACEFFWPRLVGGGVFLFDDYGWLGFEDTRRTIDDFFRSKPGTLLKLPTGQALFMRTPTDGS